MLPTLAVGLPGFWEVLLLVGIAVMFFYRRRMPDVARHLGRCVAEFKRGLKTFEDDALK
jgi:Sec-independent protein translocase protein TatA